MVAATWHPYLSKVRVWRRTRRYRRILTGAVPELDPEYAQSRRFKREWEREMLRKERAERKGRREPDSLEGGESPSVPSSVL